jgi:hypothetical protein
MSTTGWTTFQVVNYHRPHQCGECGVTIPIGWRLWRRTPHHWAVENLRCIYCHRRICEERRAQRSG